MYFFIWPSSSFSFSNTEPTHAAKHCYNPRTSYVSLFAWAARSFKQCTWNTILLAKQAMLARGKITIYFTNASFRWFLFFFHVLFHRTSLKSYICKTHSRTPVCLLRFSVLKSYFFSGWRTFIAAATALVSSQNSCCPDWVTPWTSHWVPSQQWTYFSYLARNNIPCLHITSVSHSGRGLLGGLGGSQNICVIGEVLYKPRTRPPGDALLSHCLGDRSPDTRGATPLLTLQSTGCPLNLRHILYYI